MLFPKVQNVETAQKQNLPWNLISFHHLMVQQFVYSEFKSSFIEQMNPEAPLKVS